MIETQDEIKKRKEQEEQEKRLIFQFQEIIKENSYKIINIINNKEKKEGKEELIENKLKTDSKNNHNDKKSDEEDTFIKRVEKTGRSQFVNLLQIIHSNEITSIQELELFLDYQQKRQKGKCFKDIKELISDIENEKFIDINDDIKKICSKDEDSLFCRKLKLMTVERLLLYLYWKTIEN